MQKGEVPSFKAVSHPAPFSKWLPVRGQSDEWDSRWAWLNCSPGAPVEIGSHSKRKNWNSRRKRKYFCLSSSGLFSWLPRMRAKAWQEKDQTVAKWKPQHCSTWRKSSKMKRIRRRTQPGYRKRWKTAQIQIGKEAPRVEGKSRDVP